MELNKVRKGNIHPPTEQTIINSQDTDMRKGICAKIL